VTQNGSSNPIVPTLTNLPTNEFVKFVFNYTNLKTVTWPSNVSCSQSDAWTTCGSVNGYVTAGGKYTTTWWSDGTNLYATPDSGNIQTVNAAHVNVSAFQVYTLSNFSAGTAQWLFGSSAAFQQSSYLTFDGDAGFRRAAAGLMEIDNGTAGTYRDLRVRALSGSTVLGANGVTTKVVAGTCSDSNAQATDGTMCIDSSDGRVYFRYSGTWHYAAQTAGFQIPKIVRNEKDETEGLHVGDPVIGRIDEVMADGSLHGVWEKFDLKAEVLKTIRDNPDILKEALAGVESQPLTEAK
jgi:hypothetical protein